MTDRMDTEALQALVARGNIKPDMAINQGTLDAAAAAPTLAAEVLELRAMRAAVEQAKAEVDAQLKERGMVSVDQLVQPFTPFQIHAGMTDLGFFKQWLTRKATEYAQLRAKREVKNETDDDMYDWLLGKSAAYADALANFNAAQAKPTHTLGDSRQS